MFFFCSNFLYCELGMGISRSFRRRVKDILNSFESTEFLCEWTVWWFYEYLYNCASLIIQLVKNPPAMQETPVQFLGQEDSAGEGIGYPLQYSWASLEAQLVKNLPAMWETWVWSLGQEDPLEKEVATHSSILAWTIPWTEATVHGVSKSQTWLSD